MNESETHVEWEGTQREYKKLCEKHGLTFEPFGHPDDLNYANRLNWVIQVVLREDDEEIVIYDELGNRWDTYTREKFPRVYEDIVRMLRKNKLT